MSSRYANTTTIGSSFDLETRRRVWRKATVIPGTSPDVARLDSCGALIEWSQYGVTVEGGTGWEIDHIIPVAKGGSDDLSNLQPLQWQNNRHKGDSWPGWSCLVSRVA